MKIVHVNFSLETGGTETMLVDILNEQCSQADVHFILINDQFDAQLLASINSRVTIWRIGRPGKSRNPIYLSRLNWLLHRLKPTVVHCHNHQVARLLWVRSGQRYLTLHTVQIPTDYLGRYDKLFAISQTVRQDIRQRANVEAQLNYNGVNTNHIQHRTAYCTDQPFRLVQISRLEHQIKGQHILLNALHQLVYEKGMTHLHVDFVGEGESRAYLEQLTSDLQLTDYVSFTGLKTRTELYQSLQHYHLLIQPSLIEGFGLTVAEGMAAGVPVIVSDIDGPMELIDNERYGYSFRSGDAGHLADRIRFLIANYDSPSVRTIAAQARQHARDVFDVRQTAKQYLEHYHQLA